MKRIYYTLIIILCLPIMVNAETITYNICKSGCEYSDLKTVLNNHRSENQLDDIIINFQDSETYELDNDSDIDIYVNSIIFNGNNASITQNDRTIHFRVKKSLKFENINMNIHQVAFLGFGNTEEEINNKTYLEKNMQFTNVTFKGNYIIGYSNINIDNSAINSPGEGTICFIFSKVNINNSILDGLIYAGFYGTDSNVYIKPNNQFIKEIYRLNIKNEETLDLISNIVNERYDQYTWIIETDPSLFGDYYPNIPNNIYIYQETYKTIKSITKHQIILII